MKSMILPISDRYRRPMFYALAIQVPLALFCKMLLDGGRMAHICACAIIGFWIGTTLIIVRRPRDPASSDLEYLRLGYFPLWVATIMLTGWMGRL